METEIYNCLSSKSQIKFLQCLQKFYEVIDYPHKSECLLQLYSRYSIRRFIDILTLQEQEIILQDLAYSQRKTHHYMWWGFPQEKGSWGKHIVSDKTQFYAMSEEEACCFLRQSDMLVYYTKALHLTKIIGKRGQGSLYNYFGPIDYAKLKSHLDLFLKES
jgi:uncharacterized protein (DUF1810 family)